MIFIAGMIVGAIIALVVFVAYMAPKHWDWYQQNIDLRSQLRVAVERAAHYQNLVRPNEWGPREQFDARIVPVKNMPWDSATDVNPGGLMYEFDDIKNGGD